MNFLLKIFFYVFLSLLGSDLFSQGKWEAMEIPTQVDLNAVHFVDSINGWVVGNGGTILHTTDGGENWIEQESTTTNDIIDVFFLNANLGWASSFEFSDLPYGTLLLKTTNGGDEWISERYQDDNIFINCILFTDSLNGWMGGSPHAIVRSIDGGNTWQQTEMDTTNLAFFPVLSINFYDDQYGYACGGLFDIAGVVWRTNNGGQKWYAIDSDQAPADEIHELVIFDSLSVMGAGGDPDFGYGVGIIRTIDGGYNWEYEEIGIQGNAYDIEFVNTNEVWAPLGPSKKFIYSLDGGQNWEDRLTPNETSIYDIIFPDSLHGYAVGRSGAFLKFIDAITVGIDSPEAEMEGVILKQNYPNPFTSKTKIGFELPRDYKNILKVNIIVYDINGNQVFTLEHLNPTSGLNTISFDAEDLPSGIYYYQLMIGEEILQIKKMILMR